MLRFTLPLLAPLLLRVDAFAPPSAAIGGRGVPHDHRQRHRGCGGIVVDVVNVRDARGRRQGSAAARASVRDKDFDVEAARRQLESLLELGLSSSSSAAAAVSSSSSPPEKERGVIISNSVSSSDHPIEHDPLAEILASVPASTATATATPDALRSKAVLTSIDRARRTAEIELLSQLCGEPEPEPGRGGRHDRDYEPQRRDEIDRHHERVVSELWDLWYHERGPKAASRLLKAERLVAEGAHKWDAAEAILKDLVQEFGVTWAEPLNRLATLYFLQRKLRLAERLCLAVLALKPWHVGALSGIVLVYEGLQETETATMWAARRLAPYSHSGSNKRRVAWVERAVSTSERLLLEAERRVARAFGEPDDHATRKSHREHQPGNLNDAWQ
jgi:hypothetical protein